MKTKNVLYTYILADLTFIYFSEYTNVCKIDIKLGNKSRF